MDKVKLRSSLSMRNRFVWYSLVAALGVCLPATNDTLPPVLYLKVALVSLLFTITLWEGNSAISNWLDNRISWLHYPLYRVLAAIGLQSGFTVVCSLAITSAVSAVWGVELMWAPWHENLGLHLGLPLGFTAIITLTLTSRSFFLYWREKVIEAEQLKSETLQMRLTALKTQLNPHFLFNNLNVLASLVESQPRLAQEFIQQLSDIYRYVLESAHNDLTPLEREWEFAQSYLALLYIRFGAPLQVRLPKDVPPGKLLIPLTLQVLIENAMKHNVISQKRPLLLEISFPEPHRLLVRNTFQPKNQIAPPSGIGLANIREQYKKLTGQEVVYGELDGVFCVEVPLLHGSHPE